MTKSEDNNSFLGDCKALVVEIISSLRDCIYRKTQKERVIDCLLCAKINFTSNYNNEARKFYKQNGI